VEVREELGAPGTQGCGRVGPSRRSGRYAVFEQLLGLAATRGEVLGVVDDAESLGALPDDGVTRSSCRRLAAPASYFARFFAVRRTAPRRSSRRSWNSGSSSCVRCAFSETPRYRTRALGPNSQPL
jgi:hypothetical protein